MPRKGETHPKPPVGDAGDPDALSAMLRFSAWQREKAYSESTVENREAAFGRSSPGAHERGLTRPQEITKPILERYQRHLFLLPQGQWRAALDAQPARPHDAGEGALQVALAQQPHPLQPGLRAGTAAHGAAPAAARPQRRRGRGGAGRAGPRHRRSASATAPSWRRFYSTGMRRMELIGLHLTDIDPERGTVMIRQGKGRKDRMIPIGERALAWIGKYRDDVRPRPRLRRRTTARCSSPPRARRSRRTG